MKIRLLIYLLQDLLETGFHDLIEVDGLTRVKLLDYSNLPKHNEITSLFILIALVCSTVEKEVFFVTSVQSHFYEIAILKVI